MSEHEVWRAPFQDPNDPNGVVSVLIARGGAPIPTFDGFEALFAARSRGELAIVHEVDDVASPWTIYSEEPWFAALPRFEREHLAFVVRFAPGALGNSKPFLRLLAHAWGDNIDLDNDDELNRCFRVLSEFEERIGCRLADVPSLAGLDPTLLRMANYCIDVSRAFKEKLATEWSVESIESGLKGVASRGPAGRLVANAQLTAAREFLSRLRIETIGYFTELAEEACVRLSDETRVLAYQDHPLRGPAVTLRGLQNALFTRLARDFMDKGMSRNKAVPTARELLALVVGEPYRGDDSSRFNRRNHIRWAAELKLSHQ